MRRRVSVYWTAEAAGLAHAFRPRTRLTLCGARVDERFHKPGMPRCPTCTTRLDQLEKEAATARS